MCETKAGVEILKIRINISFNCSLYVRYNDFMFGDMLKIFLHSGLRVTSRTQHVGDPSCISTNIGFGLY